MKQKILFIINPISGNNKKQNIDKTISNCIDNDKFDSQFVFTEYGKHATELAQEAVNKEFDIVVAVGGDGTVNEVTNALIGTDVKFAIVPSGSGNGLARYLKIPINVKKAVEIINRGKFTQIDTMKVNDNYCVNMAGVGFDAHISNLFASYGKRGLQSYVKLIIKEFFKYKEHRYKILIDNRVGEEEAFVISFANSTQFGNNAHIAPMAKIDDGLIDVCILKKFPAWKAPFLAARLFLKTIHKSKYYKLLKTNKLKIINSETLHAHMDGDPFTFDSNIKIEVLPKSLSVVCEI